MENTKLQEDVSKYDIGDAPNSSLLDYTNLIIHFHVAVEVSIFGAITVLLIGQGLTKLHN